MIATTAVPLLLSNSSIMDNGNNSIDFFNDSDDYEAEVNLFDSETLNKFIPAIIVFGFTFITGLIGNILVIFTIKTYKKLNTVTNKFLLSLAIADLFLLTACIPLKVIILWVFLFLEFFSFHWTLGDVTCKFMHYSQSTSIFCSVLHLTAISLERYFAIVHPFKAKYLFTKSFAIKIIILLWILSFISATPLLFGKGTLVIKGVFVQIELCTRKWAYPYYQIYELFRAIMTLFLPLLIMIITYTSILMVLWKPVDIRKHHSKHNAASSCIKQKGNDPDSEDPSDNQTRKQIIKMLLIVVIIFFICLGPVTINNLLISFGVLSEKNFGALWHVRIYFSVLCYFNSCINPIVYAFMSKNFREGFIYSLKTVFCRKRLQEQQQGKYDRSLNRSNYNPVQVTTSRV